MLVPLAFHLALNTGRAEAANTRLSAIIQYSGDAIYAYDLDGLTTCWNRSSERLFGYAESETIGRSVSLLIPPDLAHELAAVVASLQGGPRVMEFETRRVAKNGQMREVQITMSPVFADNGMVVGASSVARDITERKLIAAELLRAKQAAEEADLAKSRFLATMSHEIRTPMNGVIGMTELLLDTTLSHQQREYASTINSSGGALLTIINDILDISKIEAGQVELEQIAFDLQQVIEDVTASAAPHTSRQNLELVAFVEPDVHVHLTGDYHRLRQILMNLVGNAVKFTERGEVVLHAKLGAESDGEIRIRFEVRDTGIGITDEQQARLFKPFSQADSSTTRKYGGTGLGLAISNQLVRLMGGEIELTSVPGEGSTFSFSLTLRKAVSSEGILTAATPLDLSGLRVLIVDDNATNRGILERQILSWGMRGESAPDGPAALRRLRIASQRGEPFDLGILDLAMPGMDGLELARNIQEDPATVDLPLVIFSSMGDSLGSIENAPAVSAFLTKPVRQSSLFDSLVRAVRPETRASTSETTVAPVPDSADDSSMITVPSGGTVLVAEDNPVNQEVARRILRKFGYDVEIAQDGKEAVEACSRTRYAAVLMDCQMPVMDGFEATRRIRDLPEPSGALPIVAMTANAMQGDRERCIAAGMDDYLAKPIRSDALRAMLQQYVVAPTTAYEDVAPAPDVLSAPSGIIDWARLDGLRELQEDGDDDILTELVDLFIADVPVRLTALSAAIEREDPNAVSTEAHALKGSCANLGAVQMADTCAMVETRASAGDLSDAADAFNRLTAQFDQARAALSTEVGVA